MSHENPTEATTRPDGAAAWFQALADSDAVMLWIAGPSGGIQFFNAGWLMFTGRPLDDELGYGWLGAVHPDDRDELPAAFRARLEAGETFDIEFRLRRADGEYRWLLCRGVPGWPNRRPSRGSSGSRSTSPSAG